MTAQIGHAYEAGRGAGIDEALAMLRAVAALVSEHSIPMTTEGLLKVATGLLAQRFDPARVVVAVDAYGPEDDADPHLPRLWPHLYDGPPGNCGKGTRWTFHRDEASMRQYLDLRASLRRGWCGR
jgi:hypothetical protein